MDHSCPCKTKTSQETVRRVRKFLESTRKPKVIYTDNSLQFGKSFEDLSWNHCTSTPHRSETNGTAERSVRRIKEGASAELLLSGFDEKWWADSVECYCYLRDVQDLLADGKTHYERSRYSFGATVEYHPIAKDQSKLHHFDKKVLPFNTGCCPVDWFFLEQCLNIILFLRRTSQSSTILTRKFYQEYSS